MADFPTAAVTRLAGYNGARYFPDSNPLGLGIGGHRQNYPQSLNDSASLAAYIAATAQEVKDDAQAVVDALADAEAARDRAQEWASKPEDQVVAGGLFSALHYARKAQASATAAATFDPALYLRRDGSTFMTGTQTIRAATPRYLGASEGGGSIFDLVSTTAGQALLRVFNPASAGQLTALALNYAGAITWGGATLYSSTNLLLPSQAQAEAGAVTTPFAWSPQRDAQAIAAIAPKGFAFEGAIASATIGAGSGFNARGPISFVASGPSVKGEAQTGFDGATSTIVRTRIRIFRAGTLVYTSPEINMSHVGGLLDRVATPFAFAGLTKGLSYDVYLDLACDTANVVTYPLISGMSA